MPYCHNCGAEVAETAKFCTQCGSRRKVEKVAEPRRDVYTVQGDEIERDANEKEQAEPSEEEVIRGLYVFAAQRLSQGASERQVFEELKDKGVPDDVAIVVTRDVCSVWAAARRQSGLKGIGCGLLMLVVGGIITWATYSAAEGGGYFIVTTGLFIAGAIAFLTGLWRLVTAG